MNKIGIISIVVCAVLCLSAGMLVAGKNCKHMVIMHVEMGPVLEGPENCSGYDGCQSYEVKGTPNGTYTTHWSWAEVYPVAGDTLASIQPAILETAHGDIYIVESVIADWGAPDGYAIHGRVVGGTGRYEGATGWMGQFGNFEGDYLRMGGEICVPED